jgi:hypothetical protein
MAIAHEELPSQNMEEPIFFQSSEQIFIPLFLSSLKKTSEHEPREIITKKFLFFTCYGIGKWLSIINW